MDFTPAYDTPFSEQYSPSSSMSNADLTFATLESEPTRKPHVRQRSPQHIRRPANAFMLFRSDFIKKGVIPTDVESKQHNISRIAGDCWKRMTAGEQLIWRALAKEREAEHKIKYPDYQYKPTKRGPVQKRNRAMTADEEKVHCKKLRETFLPDMTRRAPKVSEPQPRKRKSRAKPRTQADSADAYRLRASASAPRSPVFMEPLLPPSVEGKYSYTSVGSTSLDLDPDLEPRVFFDMPALPGVDLEVVEDDCDWAAQEPVAAPAPTELQLPLNSATHIREKFDISRRGATFPANPADYQDAQAWYNPQAFFAPPGAAQYAPDLPAFDASNPFFSPDFAHQGQTLYNPAFASVSYDPPQGYEYSATLPGSSTPQPFPITLTASAPTPLASLELAPPQFDLPPNPLDMPTLSFDDRSLEDFSAGLGVDDQFGLFGQPPSTLGLGSDVESGSDWSSGMMNDVLNQEVCSRAE